MPWHFGGDPWFTYAEAEAYADALRDIQRENEKTARSRRR